MLLHNADLTDGLLRTDFGLIALNETHAVFSIRVERAKLAENHSFLNVLSDIAGGDSRLQMPLSCAPFSPASDPPGRLGKWRKAALLCTVVVGLSAVPLVEMADATSNLEPLKFISAELLTPKVRPGGEMIVKIVEHRVRSCPTTVMRATIRQSDGASVDQVSIPALSTETTRQPVTLKIASRIPSHLAPGRYAYRSTLISDCGERTFFLQRPDMSFEVLEPSAGPEALAEVPARGAILR